MNSSIKAIVLLALTLVVAQSSLFVVSEFERGIKLRFGELIEGDIQPGLHIKMPFVDNVRIFDARVLTVDAQPASFFTVEKKRLIVDSYAKWRIANVETYYTKTGGVESVAQNRLANRVNDGLRNQFGTRTLNEVVSGERDLLMKNITEDLNSTVLEELGIEVVDIRVKRIDLPQEVSSQVFRRMTAEREKEARELRSTGKEKAEKERTAVEDDIALVVDDPKFSTAGIREPHRLLLIANILHQHGSGHYLTITVQAIFEPSDAYLKLVLPFDCEIISWQGDVEVQ